MTREHDNLPSTVDDRVERLICRFLDNELSPEERAELDFILAKDEAARQLLDEYTENDILARDALLSELDSAKAVVRTGKYRGFVLASAGAILSAAAVIALSFLPSSWSTPSNDIPEQTAVHLPQSMPSHAIPHIADSLNTANPQFVDYNGDYQNTDYLPRRRRQNAYRDLIGVQTNDNVIIILERKRKTTRLSPVSGEL